jgi:hypothetical protein
VDTLYAGEVGYLAAQIKSVQDARVGDTVTLKKVPAVEALDSYQDVQPMVYCGLFPTDADDYQVGGWGVGGGGGGLAGVEVCFWRSLRMGGRHSWSCGGGAGAMPLNAAVCAPALPT